VQQIESNYILSFVIGDGHDARNRGGVEAETTVSKRAGH